MKQGAEFVGSYESYALGHNALYRDIAFQSEVANVAAAVAIAAA